MYQVIEIKNFLHRIQQRELKNFLLGSDIFWRFYELPSLGMKVPNSEFQDSPVFNHVIFSVPGIPQSETPRFYKYDLVNLFHSRIEKYISSPVQLLRIQANLGIPCPSYSSTCMVPHIDIPFSVNQYSYESTLKNDDYAYTLIYYVNTSSGDTVIFDESSITHPNYLDVKKISGAISPEEGKAVLFKGYRYHAGNTSKTDFRLIINVNFLSKEDIFK